MKKLLLLLCTLLGTAGAWAEVLNFTPGDGSYGATSGWKNTLTFSSSPILTVTASANNMNAAQVSGFWDWRSGQSQTSTYTLSVAGAKIQSYKITCSALSGDQTLTAGSVTATVSSAGSSDFEVTGLDSPSTAFTLTGANTGLKITAISVTVVPIKLTTDTNNPTYYVIRSFRSGKYANYAGASAQLTQVETASADRNALWYFVENGDGVSIVPAADPTVKLASTSSATAEGAVWYLNGNKYNPGCFCVSLTNNNSANCWDDQGGHTTIGTWQPSATDYAGTSWDISEVSVTKAEVDAGTVNIAFALTKLDVLARLAPLSSLSVYTDANIAAVRNAANETALNNALKAFETSISLYCRSNKYLVVGASACSYVEHPDAYEEAIQLESAGSGAFYLKGYKSEKYISQVRNSTAVNTTATANEAFYFESLNGYIVVKNISGGDYAYIHNGGSGCVGWVANAVNTQHIIAEVELPAALVNVTYNVKINNQTVASATVEQGVGDAPSIPSSLIRDFTTYSYSVNEITANTKTITVTPTFNLPFTVSTDYNNATWHYATLRGKQLRADENNKDNNGRYKTNSSNERTDVYKWAFFGNPYENFYVMNKAQGNDKYLYAGDVPVMQSATPASDNKARWAITKNGDNGFTLRSESGANLYINDAGNGGNLGYWNSTAGLTDGGSKWVVEDATTSDKNALGDAIAVAQGLVATPGVPGYINSTAAATLSTAINSAQSVYNNASGDYASAYYTLAAAIEAAAVPANINYTPRTDVYYTIVNARGAMIYDPSHSASVDAENGNAEYIWYGSTTPDATDKNNLWGFIENEGNYYMYNVGKKQFATVGHGGYGATWIFSDTPAFITLDDGIADEIVPPGVRVRATIATTGNSYTMSVSTGYIGPVITYDANGDGGVPMRFAESSLAVDAAITAEIMAKLEDLTPYRNALKEVIDNCADVKFGTAIGLYKTNASFTAALNAANTTYNNASATKSQLQTAKNNLEEAFESLVLNTPAAGFYRVKNVATGKYLTIVNPNTGFSSQEKGVFANGDANSAATVIKLADKDGDGHLYMYNQGYGFGWVDAGKASSSSGNVWAQTPPDKYIHWFPSNVSEGGQLAFAICYGNGVGNYAAYLTRGIYTADTTDESVIGGTNYKADAAQWIFEPCNPTDGDVNLDGVADAADITVLIDIIFGKKNPANYNADQNGDNSYSIGDVTRLVNKIKSAQ